MEKRRAREKSKGEKREEEMRGRERKEERRREKSCRGEQTKRRQRRGGREIEKGIPFFLSSIFSTSVIFLKGITNLFLEPNILVRNAKHC